MPQNPVNKVAESPITDLVVTGVGIEAPWLGLGLSAAVDWIRSLTTGHEKDLLDKGIAIRSLLANQRYLKQLSSAVNLATRTVDAEKIDVIRHALLSAAMDIQSGEEFAPPDLEEIWQVLSQITAPQYKVFFIAMQNQRSNIAKRDENDLVGWLKNCPDPKRILEGYEDDELLRWALALNRLGLISSSAQIGEGLPPSELQASMLAGLFYRFMTE